MTEISFVLENSTINVIHADCKEYLQSVDLKFDLAHIDPPYGIGEDWKKRKATATRYKTDYKNDEIPDEAFFERLKQVSTHQIIWGYNYFTHILPPSNHLIVWDKCVPEWTDFYSHCEIAYTTYKVPLRKVSIEWDGGRKGIETGIKKIHPHQKPISLYKWVLKNYASEATNIIDTHGGSMSHAIACMDMGYNLVIIEKDQNNFHAAVKRINNHFKQLKIPF